jgi:excisionase family DNA binding protein
MSKKALANTNADRLMFSREETAHRLGVSVRLLKRWQLNGKIRATRPGGGRGPVFFTSEEIDRFLKDSTD